MRPERSLEAQVVSACRSSLAKGAARRKAVDSVEAFQSWQRDTLQSLRAPFPKGVFERPRALKARLVSQHEFEQFRVENVLFESLPGWEVNGSVYLPKRPGTYPGVVCPTGHSTKTGENYQKSAQVFARNGYVAISFDPPGCAGEMAHLNDHFTNGLVGYCTGFWSQTHFVVDAMAAIDYLLTRPDVDGSKGISVTGVSGGGLTSIFTALMDDRVAFVAPVCCLAEHESIHLKGLYTSCPEQFGCGLIAAGLDYVDAIAALAPRPCLIAAGAQDEVFDVQSTRRIFEEAKRVYGADKASDLCQLFVDEKSGHAYTVAMANETVRRMNLFIKKVDADPLPLTEQDVQTISAENLLCHPSHDVNMFTVNRDEGMRLKEMRAGRQTLDQIRAAARDILGLPDRFEPVSASLRSEPRSSWHACVEEVDIQPVEDVHLPALMFSHVEDKSPRPGLLWIDEQGKWSAFRHDGSLCGALRMFEKDCLPHQPRILSLDVSGLGALSPEPTAYDLAGWNDIERILTYLSIANRRPIMGLRVRDALAGLAYLKSRSEVDPQRLMVGGRGVGAVVALHVALLSDDVRRLIMAEGLSHYGSFTEIFPFSWQQSLIIPNILQRYDLPEALAQMKGVRTWVINPLDAQRQPLAGPQTETLFRAAIEGGASVRVGVDVGPAVIESVLAEW